MTRISEKTILGVKDSSNLVEIVSERVALKKQGKNLLGLCPFHNEKTPSFTVSPDKNLYYCFGCTASGGAIDFLMELDKSSFAETIISLASRYGIPVETEDPIQTQKFQQELSERQAILEVLEAATKYYQRRLNKSPQASSYLRETRQLTEETIETWRLGYASPKYPLHQHLTENGYSLDILKKAGLIRFGDDGTVYDRFCHRIMIPICNPQGKVIGFGGRGSKQESAKYLNSPETIVFDKSQVLFGLSQAGTEISKLDYAVLVEGYFDVISLHQSGIKNVVAVLGTAIQSNQIRQLTKLTQSKTIVLNFDSDEAGIQAVYRTIERNQSSIYNDSVNFKVLTLPEVKDPDQYIQDHGVSKYQELIAEAPTWFDWRINRIFAEELNPVNLQSKLAHFLREIPDGLIKISYTRLCAERLSNRQFQLIPQIIKALEAEIRQPKLQPSTVLENQVPKPTNLQQKAELSLIRLYLHVPEVQDLILTSLKARDLKIEGYDQIWQFLTSREVRGNWTTNLQSSELSLISPFLFLDKISEIELNRPKLVIRQAIAALEMIGCKRRCADCLNSLLTATTPEEQDVYRIRLAEEQDWLRQLEQMRQSLPQDL